MSQEITLLLEKLKITEEKLEQTKLENEVLKNSLTETKKQHNNFVNNVCDDEELFIKKNNELEEEIKSLRKIIKDQKKVDLCKNYQTKISNLKATIKNFKKLKTKDNNKIKRLVSRIESFKNKEKNKLNQVKELNNLVKKSSITNKEIFTNSHLNFLVKKFKN